MPGYNFAYNFQSISRLIKSVEINLRRIESIPHDSGTMGLPELEYLVTVENGTYVEDTLTSLQELTVKPDSRILT